MDRRRDLWLLILLLGIHLYLGNEFRAFANPNVHSRVYLTLAIADHGTFAIDSCIARFGPVQDVAAFGGRTFSDKPPGYSIMLAPLAWVLRHTVAVDADARIMATWLRVLGISIPVAFFWYLTREYWIALAGDRRLGLSVMLAGALGTNFFIYATQLFSHALAGMLIFLAFRDATATSTVRAARCGLLLALAFTIDYIVAPAVAVLSIYAILNRSGNRMRGGAILLAAALPIAILWMAYNQTCFGNPFRVGFQYHTDPVYGPAYRHGLFGIQPPDPYALLGSTILPPHGIVLLSPFFLVVPAGWWRMLRAPSTRRSALASIASTIGIICFITTTIDWRGGWSVSVRYLVPAIPLLLIGAAAAVQPAPARAARFVFRVGAAIGIVQVTLIALTFPDCAPAFQDPPYDMAIPLLRAGCVNGTLWSSNAPPIALLPFAAVMLGIAGWILFPAKWLGAVAVALAIAGQTFVGLRLDYSRRLMVADAMWRMGYGCNSDAARARLHGETLSNDPNNIFDLTELAWLRAASPCREVRDGRQAIELSARLDRITKEKRVDLLELRAAAVAEAGMFDHAAAIIDPAIASAEQSGDQATLQRLRQTQAEYRQNHPFRRPVIAR